MRALLTLAAGVLLAMATWFSASALVPQLVTAWRLDGAQQSLLTVSVQLGFVAGALVSALLTLADRWSLPHLVGASAAGAALANALIPLLEPGFDGVLALRFLTGFCLAGVYPPAMKLVVTWADGDRGFWVGVLIGALTLGSSLPHLLNAFSAGGMPPWQQVMWGASALAAVGAVLAWRVPAGPRLAPPARFDLRIAGRILADRPVRLANYGYLGHMWELYAMWAWAPLLLVASFDAAGWPRAGARWAGFGLVAVGALGCIAAGRLADRLGRTALTIASLAVSGACALTAGLLFDHPGWLTALCLLWGFAVVADSAQFSAAVSELADPATVGTALTLQTSLGFALTVVTIQAMPAWIDWAGWRWGFAALAIGPGVGIVAMARLRSLPAARRMAGGRR